MALVILNCGVFVCARELHKLKHRQRGVNSWFWVIIQDMRFVCCNKMGAALLHAGLANSRMGVQDLGFKIWF